MSNQLHCLKLVSSKTPIRAEGTMYNAEWVLLDVSSRPEVMFEGSAQRAPPSAMYWCREHMSIGILTNTHVNARRTTEWLHHCGPGWKDMVGREPPVRSRTMQGNTKDMNAF